MAEYAEVTFEQTPLLQAEINWDPITSSDGNITEDDRVLAELRAWHTQNRDGKKAVRVDADKPNYNDARQNLVRLYHSLKRDIEFKAGMLKWQVEVLRRRLAHAQKPQPHSIAAHVRYLCRQSTVEPGGLIRPT